jgi:hypothetical protein
MMLDSPSSTALEKIVTSPDFSFVSQSSPYPSIFLAVYQFLYTNRQISSQDSPYDIDVIRQ